MIKNEPFMKSLKCRLTENEKSQLGKQVVELVGKKESLEDRKKAVASKFKGEIDSVWDELLGISRTYREGFEDREVQCYTEFSWSTGIAKVIRSDTYEMVSSRTITDDERQIHIDEEIESDHTEAGSKPDEGSEESSGEDIPDGGGDPIGSGDPDSKADIDWMTEEPEVVMKARTDKDLRDLLVLVMKKAPTLKTIKQFSDAESEECWAWATELDAGQEITLTKPAFLGS